MNLTSDYPDDLLRRCWKHQSCGGCLDQDLCSWCPFTQTCVPNLHAIPLLAPVYDENICSHRAERWEIRTRPLGCQVSTITTLSVLVAIASTLFVLALGVMFVRWRRGFYGTQEMGWWEVWGYQLLEWLQFWRQSKDQHNAQEREALLRP